MNEKPKGPNVLFILAPIACCGIPLLFVSGLASGIGAWLLDYGAEISAGFVILAVAGVYIWRQRNLAK